MVAHVELPVGGGMLDIQTMYSRLALNCTYQRKMFPGLIFRPEASPVVLLCFYSGEFLAPSLGYKFITAFSSTLAWKQAHYRVF